MRLYFHRLHTESHRRWHRRADFVEALERAGVDVLASLDKHVDVALCGSFESSESFGEVMDGHPAKRAQFCWDLYPMHVEGTRRGMVDADRAAWRRYVEDLRKADLVLAPTTTGARRVEQFTGRMAEVVPPACDPWWESAQPPFPESHAMDVMRPYDDWGDGKVEAACKDLGIPFARTGGNASFDAFRWCVSRAKVLVCAYDEASTGGLTLLEGCALGKAVVASDSVWNGARDIFGPRAMYFRRGDEEDLRRAIAAAWQASPSVDSTCADWVRSNFSDDAMARALVEKLKGLR